MLMRLFISFEGPEGSGKTTHTELLSEYLSEKGYDINLTREPGGTSLGEQIRELLLDPDHEDMDARSELFLYLAARAQHVTERIKPALEKGDVVICDRFTDASLVYQGIGRQLGFERVNELNEWATEQLRPDLTFILDVPVDRGLEEARRSSQTRWNTSDGTGDQRVSRENQKRVPGTGRAVPRPMQSAFQGGAHRGRPGDDTKTSRPVD
jgi:dTMP kinase